MEKEYTVKLTWAMSKEVKIKASSIEELEEKAVTHPLPEDGEYISDSFSYEIQE